MKLIIIIINIVFVIIIITKAAEYDNDPRVGCIEQVISTASGALVVGGVRDIYMYRWNTPEIGLSVQWSTTNQPVAVCGSLW